MSPNIEIESQTIRFLVMVGAHVFASISTICLKNKIVGQEASRIANKKELCF